MASDSSKVFGQIFTEAVESEYDTRSKRNTDHILELLNDGRCWAERLQWELMSQKNISAKACVSKTIYLFIFH